MGVLAKIGLDSVKETIGEVGSLIDSFHTSDEEKAMIKLKMRELDLAVQMANLEINKTQAESGSWFVAGGRPAIIWVGALALLYSSVLHGILNWVLALALLPPLPPVDNETLMPALLGVLGLGGMRTFEKTKGVARSAIKSS